MLWAKNLLFVGLCIFGGAALAANLWRQERIATPRDFQPQRFASPPSTTAPNDWSLTLARLNQEWSEHWAAKKLQPAPRADSLTLARRLSLGLTGGVPSVEEIRALEKIPADQRVEWYLSRLLEDRRTADYVGERFARAFVGAEDGPFILYRRRRFVTWLADQFAAHRGYDEIVREMIADKGLWTNNPALNFITVTSRPSNDNAPDPIRLAARTSRAFLGMRIDCLQCHDDRLGTIFVGEENSPRNGKQSDFHQLAAFFGSAQMTLSGVQDNRKKEYNYKYLHAEKEVVVPADTPFADLLLERGGDRRAQLARWVTHPENKPFARAAVNRVWAILCGRSLVEPIDDIPLFGKRPPGMDLLADDFAAHGYDLHRLIRLIVASDAFQRDSAAEFEITPEHEAEWAVFPLTRLQPQQIAGSIMQASSLATIDADAHIIWQLLKFGQTQEFVKRYGDLGEDEFTDRGGTIPQRLLLMNGEVVQERTQQNFILNAASRVALVAPENAQAIETAYLGTLSRRPSAAELEHFLKRFGDSRGEFRQRCLEDLYWTLFNCTEFSWSR